MTTSELTTLIRQLIGDAIAEVGGENPTFLTEFLLRYVVTSKYVITMLGVDASAITVTPASESITPDPFDDEIGLMLAFHAAASIVGDDLVNRLRSGEMGLSFSTGLTQITTNQAAITLKTSSGRLDKKFRMLLTKYLSGDPNTVVERLQ